MDKIKAQALFKKLEGKEIGGYFINQLKAHGKSAAVFVGVNGTKKVAVKVFDNDIIETYGDKVQLERIEREIKLKGISHPNLVPIYDGGVDKITGSHFIIMELLEGRNLNECLQEIPIENVVGLLKQLALACEFLETRGLVHRDIKPENIQISPDLKSLMLLDFGVIRPIGQPGLTDDGNFLPFIGTLQYSSPEFLLRTEKDTVEGWRAVTFYQIGAVLHDLIMRSPIFENLTQPYMKLGNAVQHVRPVINSAEYTRNLQNLAKHCLSKSPEARLKLVSWEEFQTIDTNDNSAEKLKSRILKRRVFAETLQEPVAEEKVVDDEIVLFETSEAIKTIIRSLSRPGELLPPVKIIETNSNLISIHYDAIEVHSLVTPLTLEMEVGLIDGSIGAVKLTGRNVETMSAPNELHAGSQSLEVLQGVIEDFILTEFDSYQQELK